LSAVGCGKPGSEGPGSRCAPVRRLRVGLVCYPSQGGSGVVATELARELARRGHCAHVISYQLPFRLGGTGQKARENVAFHQVEVPMYPLFQFPPYGAALANKIVEVARYERLDLLHVHYAVPHAVSAALARAVLAPARLPVITTLHGTDVTVTGTDPAIREVVTWSLQQSDAVTAVSDALAASAARAFGLASVRRIYNFIDPAVMRRRHDPALRARYARPEDAVLIHASNFRPVKNVGDVVRIFAGVVRQRPAVLLLCGDGPEAGVAHRVAHELGVADRVHFLGVQEEIAPILSIADLFLLPSSYESFGLVALEAMACEVPVVCSLVGGLPEVVEEGKTGFLRPVGDIPAMVEAALRALEPDRLATMRQHARRHAVQRFSASRILPQIEALYVEVVSGGPRGG
jgi:N-acetyl-alpha-D-glucosaminyl L-malate synthase BshA